MPAIFILPSSVRPSYMQLGDFLEGLVQRAVDVLELFFQLDAEGQQVGGWVGRVLWVRCGEACQRRRHLVKRSNGLLGVAALQQEQERRCA